jgi:hypothetical protein
LSSTQRPPAKQSAKGWLEPKQAHRYQARNSSKQRDTSAQTRGET